ncbi:hypothetical protein CDEST_00410 [Colletotrichum destructivum]|uniref:Transcription factor domain-containing protein n=1 Tax=Colletotrichum destructivum TaxID=34406 RepID=A0AAX4HW52_9PEZI|nr:hypothetical protein CDEST_00410 [Colletotrichum destructivum]
MERQCVFTVSHRGLRQTRSSTGLHNNTQRVIDLAINESRSSSQHTALGPNIADTADAGLGGESFSGFLPTLFDDDLDSFQFDDIFQGGSEAELDSFFANIFSAPSFPRASPHEVTTAIALLDEELYSQYRSHAEILSGYYRLIHPIYPILPPPLEDGSTSLTDMHVQEDIQLEASSPLMLALHALLILIPDPESDEAFSEVERQGRASMSQTLCVRALEALELASQNQITGVRSLSVSNFHPHVPKESETPLACCVLGLYQYLHPGDLQEMTALSWRAFDMSTSLCLNGKAETPSRFAESLRRTWWMSYLCVCNATIVNCKLWVHYIRAEEALVAATLLLVALLRGFASESEVSAFNRDIGILDRVIMHQLGPIGSQGISGFDLLDSPEARLAVCLRTTSRARLMRCVGSGLLSHSSVQRPNVPSARIKLHRYRAFMGHPRILKRFAAVTPMKSSERDSVIDMRRGAEFSVKAAQMFPFSSEHSHRVCLESATAIAHGLDRLRSLGIRESLRAHPATPAACSSNLAGFTLMMISHFQTSTPGAAGSEVTRQEVQRLCKEGVNTAIGALGQFSGHFRFVKALKGREKPRRR